jgi:ADP-heptose:LPS heptosyltransferase
MNTLVIFCHGLGDCVMLTGCLKEYKRLHPDESIDLLVLNGACREIFVNNPNVRNVWLANIRNPRYWNPLAYFAVDQFKVRRVINGLPDRFDKTIIVTVATMPEMYYAVTGSYGDHKVCRIDRDLGLEERRYPYDLYPSDSDRAAAQETADLLADYSFKVVHPFSSDTRKVITGQLSEIVSRLRKDRLALVVVGGTDDRCPPFHVSRLPLLAVAELLKLSQGFIGTDSVVAHLAGWAGVPIEIICRKKNRQWYRPLP